MNFQYLLFNAVAAAILFFLNGLLGRLQYDMPLQNFKYGRFTFIASEHQNFSGNFFQKIINPTVYLAVISALAQTFCSASLMETLWLIIPFFWLYRFLFMILKNAFIFLNLKYEFLAFLLSIALGESIFFGIIKDLLSQNTSIWISTPALRDAIWFAILTYICKVSWDIMKRLFTEDNLYPDKRREQLVMKRYDKFSALYGDYILEETSHVFTNNFSIEKRERLIRLIYAIMIYEDYNRPCMMRILERLIKSTVKRKHTMTLGIMQVETLRPITDCESIQMAIEKLGVVFSNNASSPEEAAAFLYNPNRMYVEEIMAIYDTLSNLLPSERCTLGGDERYDS